MEQMQLNIVARLPYSPSSFVLHAGVSELLRRIEAQLGLGGFRALYVQGDSRAGKTHLALRLAESLYSFNQEVSLVEGARLLHGPATIQVRPKEVMLIDDSHLYLETLLAGESGPFVDFVERCRAGGAPLVLFGRYELSDYLFDEHVRSRLLPGGELRIGEPAHEDIQPLVESMARQRGLVMSARRAAILAKRLPRKIAQIEHYLDGSFSPA